MADVDIGPFGEHDRTRDKNMGLLVQFMTTFTSHVICTPQP